jgi:hypothetical protein
MLSVQYCYDFILYTQATSAQIKVYGNVCPRSTDRAVAINGPIDVCIDTLGKCLALVNENPPKGPTGKNL